MTKTIFFQTSVCYKAHKFNADFKMLLCKEPHIFGHGLFVNFFFLIFQPSQNVVNIKKNREPN